MTGPCALSAAAADQARPPRSDEDPDQACWLERLRAEARRIAGECLEDRAQDLLKMAEGKMQELDAQQCETTRRLEEDLRRCRQTTERMTQDKNEMLQMINIMKQRMDSIEAAARAAGVALPPGDRPAPERWGAVPPPAAEEMPELVPKAAALAEESAPWAIPMRPPPGLSFSAQLTDPAPSSWPLRAHGTLDEGDEDEASEDGCVASGKPRGSPGEGCSTRSPDLSAASDLSSMGLSSPSLTAAAAPTIPRQTSPYLNGMLTAATLRMLNGSGMPSPAPTPMRTLGLTPKTTRSTPGGKRSPMPAPSPYVCGETGGCVFGFTLRVASGSKVGLSLQSAAASYFLRVTGISAEGAVAAWNKQCDSGPNAGKQIQEGDMIVGINDQRTPDGMLEECRSKQLLKIMVVRGQPECQVPWNWLGNSAAGQPRRQSVPAAPPAPQPPPPPAGMTLQSMMEMMSANAPAAPCFGAALSQGRAGPEASATAPAADAVDGSKELI